MTEKYDAIVVGAGHNGLVCSALLARAGKSVLVLEANAQVGGAAITREFCEGYLVSACAHLLYQLQPVVRRELNLTTRLASDNMTTVALSDSGRHIRLCDDVVTGVTAKDADQYRRFYKRMVRYSALLQKHFNRPPPRLGTKNSSDWLALGQMGIDLRMLGRNAMQDFLRIITMNVHDEVNEWFDSSLLKGAISLDAVLGTHLGPRSPNSIMTYLYRLAGAQGRIAVPAGGMGSVSNELAHAARAAGATIRTGLPVKRIVIENGRARGVETLCGDRFDSLMVISNADPKTTVMKLVGARYAQIGFTRRIAHLRASGNAAKLHLALDGLPVIPGLSEADLAGRLIIAPDEEYVERAFNPSKYGEFSPRPVIEMIIPSIHDETLAPRGKHVLSAIVQYAPYALKDGWSAAAKADCMSAIISTLAVYMPGIEQKILESELLTPVDIEREFHISGGHWHHAELTLDQFLFARPVVGAAQYGLPVEGVYMCGAGTHPGGGVSGAAGRNAARSILRRKSSR